MTPADHAAGAHAKVHVGDHAQPRERARPGLQRVGLAGEVHAADDGADRSADDDVGLDAVAGEGANDAEVGPATRRPAAKGKADARRSEEHTYELQSLMHHPYA